jgi:hypothetical protein
VGFFSLFLAPTDALLEYAKFKNIQDFVEFFSEKNRASLLHCVVDGADEVCYFLINI